MWWFKYKTPAGTWVSETSDSPLKTASEDLLKQRLGGIERTRPAAREVTFDELAAGFVAHMRAKKLRSLDNVEKYRLPHLRSYFGKKKASEITRKLVNHYIAHRREVEKAADATIQYEVKMLRRMFAIAVAEDDGRIDRVPSFPSVSVENARQGFCSADDLGRVADHLSPHLRPVVWALYLTGWRSREILRLQWADVDFEAGTLTLRVENSKSKKPRTFPFENSGALADILRMQRAQTGAMERSQSRVIRWVFHCDGKPIGSFRTVWRSAVKKAGLPGLRPHDLRRSAAREFVRTVTSESVAMALLGHRTRSMFDRYNITSTQDLAEAIVTAIPGDQLQISYMARRKVVELNGIEPSTS